MPPAELLEQCREEQAASEAGSRGTKRKRETTPESVRDIKSDSQSSPVTIDNDVIDLTQD